MSYCHKESDTTLFIPTLILKYNSSACTVRTTINLPAWGKERKEKKRIYCSTTWFRMYKIGLIKLEITSYNLPNLTFCIISKDMNMLYNRYL